MKKISLRKVLSLALCLVLIAPVFSGFGSDNTVHANAQGINSFALVYNNGTADRDLMASANNNHVTVRASRHVQGHPRNTISTPAVPIDLTLQNVRFGAINNFDATWKLVTVRSGGATIFRGDTATQITSGDQLFSMGGTPATDTIRLQLPPYGAPNCAVGRTIILDLWVTHFDTDGTDLVPGAPLGEYAHRRDNPANFRIQTVTITVADDVNDGVLGANFFFGNTASQINHVSGYGSEGQPIAIAPTVGRVVNIRNAFVNDFDAQNNTRTQAAFEWRVVVNGPSLEVAVGTAASEQVFNGGSIFPDVGPTLNTHFFNQNQRNVTVRPRPGNPPLSDATGNRSGRSFVTFLMRAPGDVNWQTIANIYFDVSALATFTIPPILINTGAGNSGMLASATTIPPFLPGSRYAAYGYDGDYVRIPLQNITVIDEQGRSWDSVVNMVSNGLVSLDAVVTVPVVAQTTPTTIPPAVPATPSNLRIYWERLAANTMTGRFPIIGNNAPAILGNTANVYIPYSWVNMGANGMASVTVRLEGRFSPDNETATRIQPVTVTTAIRDIDVNTRPGHFVDFEFEATHHYDYGGLSAWHSSPTTIYRNISAHAATSIRETLRIEVNDDGYFLHGGVRRKVDGTEIVLDDFMARVYDTDENTLMRTLLDTEFIIMSMSISQGTRTVARLDGNPIPAIGVTVADFINPVNNFNRITLRGGIGNADIIIRARPIINSDVGPDASEIEIRFRITVDNIRVFAEDIGNIVSAHVRRVVPGVNNRVHHTMIPSIPHSRMAVDQVGDLLTNAPTANLMNHIRDDLRGSAFLRGAVSDPGGSRDGQTAENMTVNIANVFRHTATTRARIDNFNAYIRVLSGAGNVIALETVGTGLGALTAPDALTAATGANRPAHDSLLDSGGVNGVLPGLRRIMSTTGAGADFRIAAVSTPNLRAEAVIEVTIVPMTGTLTDRRWVGADATAEGDHRPMTVYFRVRVNELGGLFATVICHDTERLFIEEFDGTGAIGDTIREYTFDGDVRYMFVLNAVLPGNSQANERWLPVMGSTIDISRRIPTSPTAVNRMAIRRIDGEIQDGFFSEDDRQLVNIPGRRRVATAERRAIGIATNTNITPNRREIGLVTGTAPQPVMFRVAGVTQWSRATLTTLGGIPAMPELFPMGGAVEMRLVGDDNTFHARAFRISVPRPGRAPRIRIGARQGVTTISGFNERMEWSANGIDWTFVTREQRGRLSPAQALVAFPGLSTETIGANTFHRMYVRTAQRASGRRVTPASAPIIVRIPS